MGCSPGSPCNPSPLPMIYAAYPANCVDIPNGCCPTSKTLYDGPNLPNTGIDNKDTVSVAFDKIDDALDPTTIVQNFINIISVNPALAVIFCNLVGNCNIPTTTSTSTSTSTSTTTVTTTACPQSYLYNYYAIEDSRNLAPAGWHVPSLSEWTDLFDTQGGDTYEFIDPLGWLTDDYWGDPNELTNGSGLSLRKNNYRQSNGFFDSSYSGIYWTNDSSTTMALYGCCGYWEDFGADVKEGYAIRLIKDDSIDTGTMIGNDGRVYPTVQIGTQVWMAQDLQETKYRNGDDVPKVSGDSNWANLETGARCTYNDLEVCNPTTACMENYVQNNSEVEDCVIEYEQCDGTVSQYTLGPSVGLSFCTNWNSINVLSGSASVSYNGVCSYI